MEMRRPIRPTVLLCALIATLLSCGPTVKEADNANPKPDVGFADVPLVTTDVTGTPDSPDVQPDTVVTPDTADTEGDQTAPDTSETSTPDVTTPDVPKDDTPCVPDCNGRICGPNGCGSLCGFCLHPEVCNEFGQCVAICVKKCDGKDCGPDGCGGQCGECADELVCGEVDQLCHEPDCVPDCTDKFCGTDGCGSTCGDCPAPKVCELGACFLGPCGTVDSHGECQGPDKNIAVWCEDLTTLVENDCSMAPNHKCTYDPNSKKYQCTDKGPCVPKCDGKLCGDDGCNGICPPGCSTGWACAAGECKPEQGANCGSITGAGECQGNTLWFCASKVLYSLDCADTGEKCKWDQSALSFDCQ